MGYLSAALLTALPLALLLARLLAGCSGPRGGIWYFGTIFLSSWAAGLWVRPVGPAVAGVHPVPVLFTGLAVSFLWMIAQGSLAGSARERRTMGMMSRVNRQNRQDQMSQSTHKWVCAFFFVLTGLAIWVGYIE